MKEGGGVKITLKEELITVEIDRCTDILRILEAGEGWRAEANNQLRKIRAKLESLGVSVEPLKIEPLKIEAVKVHAG